MVRSKRFVVAVLLAAALGAPAAAASSAKAPSPISLAQVLGAPSLVSYSGVVESVRIGDRGTQATVYRVEHRAPDLTRRTYTAPSEYFGVWELVKGNVTYTVNPARRRIVETRNDATLRGRRALGDDAQLIAANYRASVAGFENFDGRPVVERAPRQQAHQSRDDVRAHRSRDQHRSRQTRVRP